MRAWPEELTRFAERDVPVFIHLAFIPQGEAPFTCRGYGFRLNLETGVLWVYILRSQWLRGKEAMQQQKELSALLTSGVDNESYQFKGRFTDFRSLTKEDALTLEEQRKRISLHTPSLVPIIQVMPSDCLAIGFGIRAVFSQTPGPGAGHLLIERNPV